MQIICYTTVSDGDTGRGRGTWTPESLKLPESGFTVRHCGLSRDYQLTPEDTINRLCYETDFDGQINSIPSESGLHPSCSGLTNTRTV
jgi:hypothetical protein